MNDPLLEALDKGTHRDVFVALMKRCEGMDVNQAYTIGVNLIVNIIRMTTPSRVEAEKVIDDIFRKSKTLLLDLHYDPVTGQRRSVFPFTQMARAPFVPSESQILPPTGS
jgi:hypothetical protein